MPPVPPWKLRSFAVLAACTWPGRAFGLASRNRFISSTVAWIIAGGCPSSIILHPPTVPSNTIALFASCVLFESCARDDGPTIRNARRARKHPEAYLYRIMCLLMRLFWFLRTMKDAAFQLSNADQTALTSTIDPI